MNKKISMYNIWKVACRTFHLAYIIVAWLFRYTFYGEIHSTTYLHRIHRIPNPRSVFLGKHVTVLFNGRIEAVTRYNDKVFNPKIVIDENVCIQQNLHLTCADCIHIGKNTAIAANVTITDIIHPYEDINLSIEKQDIEVKSVEIGQDCKIYNNAIILPGITIGKHCVIGANSVVTKDIPDYSVAVGIPAKVIKQWSTSTNKWVKM